MNPGTQGVSLDQAPVEAGGKFYFRAYTAEHGYELWVSDGTTDGTHLVKDLYPGASYSTLDNLTSAGGKLYFRARTPEYGHELWVSDGTEAGTHLVKDIRTGGSGASPQDIVSIGDGVAFSAHDGSSGYELWVTDGTEAGTRRLGDLFPGWNSASPQQLTLVGTNVFFTADDGVHGRELFVASLLPDGPAPVLVSDINTGTQSVSLSQIPVEAGGKFFFQAYTAEHGYELWVSDGTTDGTHLVKDILPGTNYSALYDLTVVGEKLYFQAYTPEYGYELWVSDGTETGTHLVKDIQTGSSSAGPHELTAVGDKLFFRAYTSEAGYELWISDGTEAGTYLVKEFFPGTDYSTLDQFVAVGNKLFFRADDPVDGLGLWVSDGTETGTVRLRDGDIDWSSLLAVGDQVYFRGNSAAAGYELWVSDGTAAGTRLLKDLYPGADYSTLDSFFVVDATLYFRGSDGTNTGLWVTDGTEDGTVYLRDGNIGWYDFAALGGRLYFSGYDAERGWELWSSDGTVEGTAAVHGSVPSNGGSEPRQLTVAGGRLYFIAYSSEHYYEVWTSDGTAEGTVRLSDTGGSDWWWMEPANLTAVGGKLFFTAYTDEHGTELWVSDGTVEGTHVVEDVAAGATKSLNPWHMTAVGDKLFFFGNDGGGDRELWVSDGTAEGTFRTRDIGTDPATSNPRDLVRAGSKLFFVATDADGDNELWVSDGTQAGTSRLKDIRPGADSSNPGSLTVVGDRLYFLADAGDGEGSELWISDGTAAGTVRLTTNADPSELTAFGGRLYFSGYDAERDYELWSSDGTVEGTATVADVDTDAGYTSPSQLTVAVDRLYFTAYTSEHSYEVWTSDGTAEGTVRLSDTGGSDWWWTEPADLTAVGGKLFFTAYTDEHGTELWVSDGTAEGTHIVEDVAAGATKSLDPWHMTAVGDKLFFFGNDGGGDRELWVSDGTAEGTFRTRDIGTDPATSNPRDLVRAGGKLFFVATDADGDNELWVSDGTQAGTSRLKDIRPGADSSNPSSLTVVGDRLYFLADAGDGEGSELWISDGTTAGTVRLTTNADPSELTAFGGRLYFSGYDAERGWELWSSDGTVEGTAIVADVDTDAGYTSPSQLTVAGDRLYFTAYSSDYYYYEVWTSDGTAEGTVRLTDNSGYEPGYLTAVGDRLFFTAYNDEYRTELWVSDGTAAGTVRLTDNGVYEPSSLMAVGDRLLFQHYTEEHGWSLWASDGTEAGTVRLRDDAIDWNNLAVVGGTLFFRGYDADHGYELWASDGTADGTRLVKDLYPGTNYSTLDNLVAAGGRLYFRAYVPDHGVELWVSDGSEAGTHLVKDIAPDGYSSDVRNLTAVGEKVVFSAYDDEAGYEPWISDGTADGTFRLGDLYPGYGSSDPQQLTAVGGQVFFTASDGVHNRELFVVTLNSAPGDLDLDGLSITESAVPGTVVGTVSVSDPDTGDDYTLSLVGDAGNRFVLDGNVLKVAAGAAFDHETEPAVEVTLRVTDSEGLAYQETFAVTVTNVNERPWHEFPSNPQTLDNATLVFSTTNENRVTVQDQDAGDGTLQVRLSVDSGTLTLGGTAGLTFTESDGTADAAMTFTGTLAAINTALDGLAYSPVAGFNGFATVTITTNDLGNSGSGGELSAQNAFSIRVVRANEAPVAGQTDLTTPEETAVEIDLRTLASDAETSDSDLTFTVGGAVNGAIELLEDGYTARFTPAAGYVGVASFTYSVTDTGDGTSPAITVGPILIDVTVTAPPRLRLTFSPAAFVESAGPTASTVTVTRNAGIDRDLVVTLAGGNGSAAVPTSVTILAGQTSATFSVAAIDNDLVDGNRTAVITASAAGFEEGEGTLTITDDDVAALTLEISEESIEEGGEVTATLRRNWAIDQAVAVSLAASTASQLSLPTVIFAAGESSITFVIETVQNTLPEKDELLTLTSSATGFADGTAMLTVTDHADLPTLTISPTSVSAAEGDSGVVFTVSRAVAVDTPLTVKLFTSDPSIASLSDSTVIIAAGETSATFTVVPNDNAVADGTRSITITASGSYVPCGCRIVAGSGIATFEVLDDDAPSLTLTVDRLSAPEGQNGALIGTVSRNTSATDDLVVTLGSSDITEAAVPATVTILAGQKSATFIIDTLTDGVADGPQSVTLTASATGLPSDAVTVTVFDIDTPDLTPGDVALPAIGLIGRDVTVTWTLRNTGRVTTSDSWVERVYLSAFPVFDNRAVLVATQTASDPLAPGAEVARSATVTLPDTPGRYYAFVVADASDVLDESDETNNVGRSAETIAASPTYTATVGTAVSLVSVGSPVTLSGVATLVEGGIPAANVAVTVRIVNEDGIRRVLEATTDSQGRYSVTFVPLGNEAGVYRVAAAHPGVAEDAVQDEFSLAGMRTSGVVSPVQLVPGVATAAAIDLVNLGSVPLTGLAVEVIGAPANLSITAGVASATLSADGTVKLTYSVTAANASVLQSRVLLRVTSAEGVVLEVPVEFRVVPLTPKLVVDAGVLQRGMVRGGQTIVSFEVTNVGGAPTGNLEVRLPALSWLSLASPAVIPSLAAGQKTVVTLTLTPPADMALGRYDGWLVIGGTDVEITVPFQFRALSDAVGDVRIGVEDEYTFFTEARPLVAGATVVLRDPFDNTVIVAEGVTDASGRILLTDVAEGTYLLEVRAEKHSTYRASFTVRAGVTNETEVFVSREFVTYNWNVTQVGIEDNYTVTLESTFETNVPAPVVIVDAPDDLPDLAPGESELVELTVTNYGLIAAEEVTLLIAENEHWELIPLITDLGTVAAKSSYTIPAIIRARAPVSGSVAAFSTLSASSASEDDGRFCRPIVINCWYLYKCSGAKRKMTLQKIGRVQSAECRVPSFNIIIRDWLVPAPTGWSPPRGNGGGVRGQLFTPNFGVKLACASPPPPQLLSRLVGEFGSVTMAAAQEEVCATVKIQIDQDAVVTRAAFRGMLEINNNSLSGDLTGVRIQIDIRDSEGNLANDKFTIQEPVLTGLTAVDGTGMITAGATGSAVFTFVPNDDAAPIGPATYEISGSVRHIDPETGQEVVIPLFGTVFEVLPNPNLDLHYFQQRDVIGDDPFTDEVEPSETFDLGLLVTNTGLGTAEDFTITSSQPKIIENEKGLLIDFKIVGSQVGGEAATPSLTVDLGDITPGYTQVATWQLTSTLQGRFIDYSATFEHVDGLGDPRASIIDTVTIHELIKRVRASRPGDDGLSDFLVNDEADPNVLPDRLYLSDGTVAVVNTATEITIDGPVTRQDRQVVLTASMTSGWSYLRLSDPGDGYRLSRVVRSDGVEIAVGENAWQTRKVFAEGDKKYRDESRLHLLDFDGTGSYTLYYVLDDAVAPSVVEMSPVSPDPRTTPVDSIDVTFTEEIDLATFDWQDITLTRNDGPNLIAADSGVAIAQVSGATYRISGLAALTAADGAYEITVAGAGVRDYGENAGSGIVSTTWSNGDAPVYVKSISPVAPDVRNAAVDAVEVTLSKAIDPASFTAADLSLSRDGATVILPAGIVIEALEESTTRYRISGLAGTTGHDGQYVLTVNAAGLTAGSDVAGVGTGSVAWTMDTLAPQVVGLETIATNPRNIVVQTLEITFSEDVDLSTFDRSDVVLTRDGADVSLDERVIIEQADGSVYRIKGLNWFVGPEGVYVVSVDGASILDLAGNAGAGSASTTWVMDTTRPTAPLELTIAPDTGVSASDGLTNTRSVVVAGTLGEAGLTVRLYDVTADEDLGYAIVDGTNFSAAITLSGVGNRTLRVYAIDLAGNVSEHAFVDLFIDESAPASAVSPLEFVQDKATFLVQWSGDDGAGGSGIASYDVYVSTDDGPFAVWLTETTLTEASFVGEAGRTYAFYSVARDNAGNSEATPKTPDAQTSVAVPAGITVTPEGGLETTEAGGTASFRVVLKSRPTADVIVSVASDDSREGTVSVSSLAFTPDNWNVAQTVVVTGVDDSVDDGDVGYHILLGPAASTDSRYDGLSIAEVSLTNVDDDEPLPPPTIADVDVQSGLTQRSYVDQIELRFDTATNLGELITDGTIVTAVELTNLGVNADADADTAIAVTPEQFRHHFDAATGNSVLVWSLDGFVGGRSSLADGSYRLLLRADMIAAVSGVALDGNGDGNAGGDFVFHFHRLEGDATGDGHVDAADSALVVSALGARVGEARWNPNADLNRNGAVTTTDRRIVAMTNGNSIAPPSDVDDPDDSNLVATFSISLQTSSSDDSGGIDGGDSSDRLQLSASPSATDRVRTSIPVQPFSRPRLLSLPGTVQGTPPGAKLAPAVEHFVRESVQGRFVAATLSDEDRHSRRLESEERLNREGDLPLEETVDAVFADDLFDQMLLGTLETV